MTKSPRKHAQMSPVPRGTPTDAQLETAVDPDPGASPRMFEVMTANPTRTVHRIVADSPEEASAAFTNVIAVAAAGLGLGSGDSPK